MFDPHSDISLVELGNMMFSHAAELYPICRSITGEGIRRTLSLIGERIPLQITHVRSGTSVFDWTVPKEWNIRDAYIQGPDGSRIVDFKRHNLHVVNYSSPIHSTMTLDELRPHLHTLPHRPEWIPYRTSYYEENWGFCLPHNQLLTLEDGRYSVHIDSSLEDGFLTYGECYLPGRSSEEVLISCHICHPSLANDNLSGLTVATALAQALATRERQHSFRFLFIPGTIGAITWLARNPDPANRVRHGLVLTCLGDEGGFHYKKSRRGDAGIDRAMAYVLQHQSEAFEVVEFSPVGYDERQYCSPGFNLPMGCLMRSVWGTFPEYHTSADNLEFIRPLALARALRVCRLGIDIIENDRRFINGNPHCEPQLGRRKLYSSTGDRGTNDQTTAMLWVLNFSDGRNSVLDIAERSGLPFHILRDAAERLLKAGLLSAAP